MNWKLIFELFLQYGPEVLKLILELFDKNAEDRAVAAKNFNAMFLAATRENDWKGMLLAQTCSCAMGLSEEAFTDFNDGLQRVASGLAAAGAALQAPK